jgi:hypothetical protein
MTDDDDIPVLTESIDIPVLTETVEFAGQRKALPILNEFQLNELRIRLTDSAYGLMERLLYSAIREMENALLEDLANHLRDELPEMIDKILQEHLSTEPENTDTTDH